MKKHEISVLIMRVITECANCYMTSLGGNIIFSCYLKFLLHWSINCLLHYCLLVQNENAKKLSIFYPVSLLLEV